MLYPIDMEPDETFEDYQSHHGEWTGFCVYKILSGTRTVLYTGPVRLAYGCMLSVLMSDVPAYSGLTSLPVY